MAPTLFGFLMFLAWPFLFGHGVVYLAILSTLFGGTAAAFAVAIGNATIVPAMVALFFLGVNILRKEGLQGFLKPITFGSATFWLALLTLWGVVSALTLPRLFKGQFLVASYDRNQDYTSFLSPIQPISMNITQSLYLVLALFTFVMLQTVLKRKGAVHVIIKAILVLAALNVLAAFIELAQHYAGLPPLLPYLKNANYVMLGGEVGGLMRITGTFPETSVFSVFTLTLVGFLVTLWTMGHYKRWAAPLAITNLVLLLLSTSGTAYVTLMICLGTVTGLGILHLVRYGQSGPYRIALPLICCLLLGLIAVLLFVPAAPEAAWHLVDTAVGKKMTSESGSIRSALNRQAMQTFSDTFGLGAGLGSVRGSSFITVVLSNVGWVGALFLLIFLIKVLRTARAPGHSDERWALAQSARNALIVNLVAVSLIGLVFDLGALFYMLAAAAYLDDGPRTPSSLLNR